MSRNNLASVDLNLLVVLDALLAERNATRAAARVGLTQPAVSHTLSRLRGLFGDPLFVRATGGLEPTPMALAIQAELRAVLERVEILLSPDDGFDPARSERTFVLGMSDYAAFVLLPALTARLAQAAPGVRLVVRHTSHRTGIALLDAQDAELVVGNFPEPPARLSAETLFEEGFLCAARAGHPAFAGPLTLESWRAHAHLNVSLAGEPSGYVDAVLAERGLDRRIAVTIGHFLMAPHLLPGSDLIATEPTRVLEPLAAQLGLATAPPPLPIPPFRVMQMWPRRLDTDPGHAWLRAQVRGAP